MTTKLGAHVLRLNDASCAFIAAGPAVVKFVGDWGYASAVPAGTWVIGRQVARDDAQSQRAAGKTPAQAAEQFLHAWGQLETYQHNPAIRYWEGHNEPVWGDAAGMSWYAQFEIERMKRMEALGLRCVIGNFATGTPPLELWPSFLPACQYAMAHDHMLGLHEYSTPFMWWMTGNYQVDPTETCKTSDGRLAGWTTLRYRQVYDRYLAPAGLGTLRLVISEAGLDPLVGPVPEGWPTGTFRHLGGWWNKRPREWGYPLPSDFVPGGGWHHRMRDRFYAEQLWWYDQHLCQDPFVVGATIFTFGNVGGPWADFDVTGTQVAALLTRYVGQGAF